MIAIVLKPGEATLADWQAIYRGAVPKLDAGCRALVERGAQAVARIVTEGKPVYGINTGFGKLASVRIDTSDLARLQRNIVLSHAAGVGEPLPISITRLMMALKLASLGSKRCWRTRSSLSFPRRARSAHPETWRRSRT